MDSVALTQTVKKGGCAAKLPAGELKQVLAGIQVFKTKRLVVGSETLDDACLWELNDDEYLIQTLDFFTPIVDDPYDFGAIAAANSLSDVYAMGGQPRIALSILTFPAQTLPSSVLGPLMKGATDKLMEAETALGGGHTIDDETLKLGFSVTGFVNKKKAWTNAAAQTNDVLILTKALGTGTITSALKLRKAESEWVRAAIASMTLLNKVPQLIDQFNVHAATDITGFGLGGHAMQMAQASGRSFTINVNMLPVLPGAMECLKAEVLNRAHFTNWDYIKNCVEYGGGVTDQQKQLICDPQTSGGLLLAVAETDAEAVLNKLKNSFPATTIIGRVHEEKQARVNFQ
jgi:selenide, water dikinase